MIQNTTDSFNQYELVFRIYMNHDTSIFLPFLKGERLGIGGTGRVFKARPAPNKKKTASIWTKFRLWSFFADTQP